jgi:beta-barrel assembly-enhancing protease
MKRHVLSKLSVFTLALSFFAPSLISAQTKLKPGMNFFSLRDEVEIGRRSAYEIDRKYRSHSDPRVESIGRRLASRSAMPNLPWRFRVIEKREVNAFALPGGFIYVTSGLMNSVRNEDELAGVLAHEVLHVTLRHGTNRVSKGMMLQMPLQVLGGFMGRGVGSQLSRLGLSFGLNSVFLKYGRDAETQADVGAVQLMRRAGYNPNGLASFLGRLQGRGAEFFSDHPNPSNRVERVEREMRMLDRR